MSASADLQLAIEELLSAQGALRVPVEIVKRRTKNLADEIAAAAANKGLCIYVMPPLPTKADPWQPFVFFTGAEIRISIFEQPVMNTTGADAYDLVPFVAQEVGQHINNRLFVVGD